MPKKILVVGSGGREHALIRQLALSASDLELVAVPGNAGTAAMATNVDLDVTDHQKVVAFCRDRRIDLVLVGPEDPLIAGLADAVREGGVAAFGPGASGARLEGDKAFAKEVMTAAGVPTARYVAFDDFEAAAGFLSTADFPVVVKACGAAQGKGVAVCRDRQEALAHLDLCLRGRCFGAAGEQVLIEECLTGEELSVLAVTDGTDYALLAPSRDHKRVGDGDAGPNTGGMGAFAPVRVPATVGLDVTGKVIEPVLAELARRSIPYCGVLYAGLMLTAAGPKVLEFNCRFGDPETQVVLPLLRHGLLPLLEATVQNRLGDYLRSLPDPRRNAPLDWPGAALTDWERHCVVVVGAMADYPAAYPKGVELTLPEDRDPEAWIVHAGTALKDSRLVTAGGRVLGAVGAGSDLATARGHAYRQLDAVRCAGLFSRRDIAAVARAAGEGDHG